MASDSPPKHLADRLTEFTGRSWVLEKVAGWLNDPEAPRIMLITGEPGCGKTALTAWLSAPSDASAPDALNGIRSVWTARHFCVAEGSDSSLLPTEFARLLAQQISERVPEFGPAVLEFVAPTVQTHIDVHTNLGTVIGNQIGNLIINCPDPKEVYHRSVRQPLTQLYKKKPDTRICILVDALDEALTTSRPHALDEALTTSRPPSIVDLLAGSADFPPNVRFLLTSRSEMEVLGKFPRACQLRLSDPAFRSEVDADSRAYIVQRRVPGLSSDDVEALVAAAAGNFLYVRLLLDEIACGARVVGNVALPVGLHALYHTFLERLTGKRNNNAWLDVWRSRYQPLLGRLSVAADAVPQKLLGEWTEQPEEVAANLDHIYQFVERSADGAGYRLYHHSMGEFLALGEFHENGSPRPNCFETSPSLQHRAISNFYLKRFHGGWQDCDAYGMRHLPWHLQKAGESSHLRQLVLSPDWLQAKLERAIQADSIEDRQLLGRLDPILRIGLGDSADLIALATLLQRQSLLLSGYLPVDRHLRHFLMQQIHNAALELGLRDLSKDAERRLRQSQVAWVRALWKAENESPELERTFLLNRSRIFSVALSPDGKLVAAGNEEGGAKIWDVETGWTLQAFDAEEEPPLFQGVRLAGSAAGGYQLRRFTESALTVWDSGTRATRSEFTVPDDAMLVSATADGQWRVLRTGMTDLVLVDVQGARSWSMNVGHGVGSRWVRAAIDGSRGQAVVSDGWQVWLLRGAGASTEVAKKLADLSQRVLALAISDDGRFAAGRSGDDTVRIWDLQMCEEIWSFQCVAGRGLAFFGDREVVVSDESTLKMWDFVTRRTTPTRVLASHLARIDAVTGTPGSPRLASADAGGTVKVWNLTAASHHGARSMRGEAALAIAVTSDAKRLISVHGDGTRYAWDAKTGECVRAWPGERLRMAAFTPGARYAIVSQRMDRFKVWDLKTGAKPRELRVGGRQGVACWAVSSDGRRFAAGTHEGYCKAWDVRTRREIMPDALGVFSRADPSREEEIEIALEGKWDRDSITRTRAGVRAVAFTHGDRRLTAIHSDGSAEQWDLKTGTANALRTEGGPFDQIIPLPAGDHAVVFQGAQLYVWGLEDGTKELLGQNPSPTLPDAAQVDRQGRYVVCCLEDRRMAVWDLRAREVLAHVPFDNTPTCIAVGSDNAVFVGDVVGNIYGLAIEGLGVKRSRLAWFGSR